MRSSSSPLSCALNPFHPCPLPCHHPQQPLPLGLCNWAAAMCKYHNVAKVVEPKIATLRAAEAELKVRLC